MYLQVGLASLYEKQRGHGLLMCIQNMGPQELLQICTGGAEKQKREDEEGSCDALQTLRHSAEAAQAAVAVSSPFPELVPFAT